jgi:hypothetical protein
MLAARNAWEVHTFAKQQAAQCSGASQIAQSAVSVFAISVYASSVFVNTQRLVRSIQVHHMEVIRTPCNHAHCIMCAADTASGQGLRKLPGTSRTPSVVCMRASQGGPVSQALMPAQRPAVAAADNGVGGLEGSRHGDGLAHVGTHCCAAGAALCMGHRNGNTTGGRCGSCCG